MTEPAEGVRLQKVLAAAGIASRRACEVLISEGRVEVNSEVVLEQGRRVDPEHDVIRVDGSRIPPPMPPLAHGNCIKKRAPTEADAPFEPFKAPVRLHLLLFAHFSRSVPCATRLRAIGLCLCGGRSCEDWA